LRGHSLPRPVDRLSCKSLEIVWLFVEPRLRGVRIIQTMKD
jgi:hypothetical protein